MERGAAATLSLFCCLPEPRTANALIRMLTGDLPIIGAEFPGDPMGTKRYLSAFFRLAASSVLSAFVLAATACSTPEVSFAGYSDQQLKGLLPATSEIEGVVGQKVALNEPEPMDLGEAATAAPNPGLFQDCYEAYFGAPESNALGAVRGYRMAGWTEGSPLYPYVWHLVQRRSSAEAQRVIQETRTRLGKCAHFTAFDPQVRHGLGVSFRKITGVQGSMTGAGVAVAVGDVTASFSLSGLPQSESEAIARDMAVVMERRLQTAGSVSPSPPLLRLARRGRSPDL
jgi:hypothetical protein